jgi:AcrR family transcriptional regulator
MAKPAGSTAAPRGTLNRERVLAGAVAYADANGVETLSMRNLAAALDVKAMSLYNHVANKDDLLDGIVDEVAAELQMPAPDGAWRAVVRRSALAAHEVLLRHPWVAALAESRLRSGPRRLAYYDAILGVFRRGGFSVRAAHRANITLDSYLYGFVLQEVSWPQPSAPPGELAREFLASTPVGTYPYLVEVVSLFEDGIDLPADFEAGLDVVLDGLERLRTEKDRRPLDQPSG